MKINSYSLLGAIIGFCFKIEVNLVGTFRLAELLLLLVVIINFSFIYKIVKKSNEASLFSAIMVLTIIFQFYSNVYNGIDPQGFAKGMANLIFIFTSFLGLLFLFMRKKSAILWTLTGVFVSSVLLFETPSQESQNLSIANFDLYIVPALNPLLLVLSMCFWKNRIALILSFSIYGLFCLGFDARSNGLIMVVMVLIYISSQARIRITSKILFPISILVLSLFYFLFSYYGEKGALGEKTQEQLNESRGGVLGLIETTRAESLVGLYAFGDRPFIGHGTNNRTNKYSQLAVNLGLLSQKYAKEEHIPTHSILVVSLVSMGFFGGIIWVYILIISYKYLVLIIKHKIKSKYIFVIFYFCCMNFWHILFSPMGYARYHFPILGAFTFIFFYYYRHGIVLGANRKTILSVETNAVS
ncbi:MAG TPA: hypothetical protein PKA00_17295 [Saprospiraceae bacterium]|nr:hypothetical protein [Saprospiraceae bacterium]HMQ84676.1 hypothetical protein [Saprospiraceae bacterium]